MLVNCLHSWLALISGVFIVIGVAILLAVFTGLTYGLDPQVMIATAVVLLVIAAIAAWMLYAAIKAQYLRIKTGKEALIGVKGIATTDIKPTGEIRVMGEFWQAITKSVPIGKRQTVEVIGMEGMFLVVKATEEKFNSSEH